MISKEVILSRSRLIKKESYIVYALIDKGVIVYIGQSSNLLTRLGRHLMSNKKFDSWSIVEDLGPYVSSSEFDRIEAEYIKEHQPKYNRIRLT